MNNDYIFVLLYHKYCYTLLIYILFIIKLITYWDCFPSFERQVPLTIYILILLCIYYAHFILKCINYE